MSCIPRAHLYDFVERCRVATERIVLFTAVNRERVAFIQRTLVDLGDVPPWFANLDRVNWDQRKSSVKDLKLTGVSSIDEAILVDDYEVYVDPSQKHRWIQVPEFTYPYSEDEVLLEAWQKIERLC
jgi:hypothetical protein